MRHLKYLHYLIRHKWHVGAACFRRGLYWRGLIHDWSKFLPSEWFPYANFFYGKVYSEEESKRCLNIIGCFLPTKAMRQMQFDRAWLAHQHRNPHHWQHWVLRNDNGSTVALEMPHVCVLEMVSDWDGAGMAINGKLDTANWYLKNREKMLLHERTRELVERLLGITPDWV